MQLTILGSSASQPAPGDACSSYLVQDGDTAVLLDCGSGTLGRLQEHIDPSSIDAIFVSHMHPDHYIDLIALRYGRRYGAAGAREIPVHLPPGGGDKLQRVSEAISSTQPFFPGALTLSDYTPGVEVEVGELCIRPHEVVHGIRSFGMHVSGPAGAIAYSSDTVRCDELVDLARGADLLLAENTLGGGAPSHHDPVTHMSAEEAGSVATEAGVPRLVLTHFWYTADRDLARREAASTFRGQVTAARPGLKIAI